MLKEGAEKRADDAEMVLKRFRLQVKFAQKYPCWIIDKSPSGKGDCFQ